MAKKRRNWNRAARIRGWFRHVAEIEVDAIDEFRTHVRDASISERRSIERRATKAPKEVQEFLADDLYKIEKVNELADQLAMVALYRVLEISNGRILRAKFGDAAAQKAKYFKSFCKFLLNQGIAIESLKHFRVFNEIRLLNNAVKHEARVSGELAQEFPHWKQGDDLKDLGKTYDRLKGRVPTYVFRFAERLKLRYVPPTPPSASSAPAAASHPPTAPSP